MVFESSRMAGELMGMTSRHTFRYVRTSPKNIRFERQEAGRWANSHQPFRWFARAPLVVCGQTNAGQQMLRFRRVRSLQKSVAVHASVSNHFDTERHLYSRQTFKLNHAISLAEWRGLPCGLTDCQGRKIETSSHLSDGTSRRPRAGLPNRYPMRFDRVLCCLTCFREPASFLSEYSSCCETP